MTSPFDTPDAPASGDRFVIADHIGELCVIRVKSHERDVETTAGVADVIVADLTIVDGPHKGEQLEDAWLFGKVLQGQLKRKVGRTVLGRFGQGEKQAGKTPAWVLNPASEDDTALALRTMTELSQADSFAAAATGDADTPPWERRA